MHYDELLIDDVAFSALHAECSLVFDTNKRLPEKVFRPNFAKYYAFEHGQIFRKDFAFFLTSIANVFADSAVNYMTIVPDPVDYYRKNCGFYGLASFTPINLMENYLKVMFRDGGVDSFRARGGDVGVLWGSSRNWGIFCDRISWDVCLMGTSFEPDESIMSAVGCMDTERLKTYLIAKYKHRQGIAFDFIRQLNVNYPALR